MRKPIKAMIIMGTRPETTKLAPLALELNRYPKQFHTTLVGTGQHRDMVPQQLRLFGLELDHDLKVMKPRQKLAELTARTMQRMDTLLEHTPPDLVLVEGDTTAVFGAALAAFYRWIPVAHVEAGLRSGEPYNPFPEEMNRRLVAPIAAVHLAPTTNAKNNLLHEGIPAEAIYVTGNTSIDALLYAAQHKPDQPAVAPSALRGKRLVLVTAHRRESWGEGIRQICLALSDLVARFPDIQVVYAVHPNPIVRETVNEVLGKKERVLLIEPPDYAAFVALMAQAELILTDSGGIQEEAPSLRKPVLVMRETTERTEGVDAGCSELVGTKRTHIVARATHLLTDAAAAHAMTARANPYGDGRASVRIRQAFLHHFGRGKRPADF
jgi:UDP-N-acetylglucosamine 2-epimerase (non-hydrolysing)